MNPYDPEGREVWQSRRRRGRVDPDYALDLDDANEMRGANARLGMTVMGGGRMFKRRAIQGIMAAAKTHVTWLVGELDGVYCYAVTLDGGRHHVVLTRRPNLVP